MRIKEVHLNAHSASRLLYCDDQIGYLAFEIGTFEIAKNVSVNIFESSPMESLDAMKILNF